MPQSSGLTWRAISNHWSVIFAVAVAIWFALSALSVPSLSFDNPFADDEAVSAPEPDQGPKTVSSSSKVEVKSFSLDAKKSQVQAELTLEVRNSSSRTVTFRPDSLALRQIGGPTTTPINLENSTVDIASNRTMVVPVTFPVNGRPASNYELTYAGNTIFTGRPI